MSADTPDEEVPFTRETGLFIASYEDGELRLHRREGARYFWHRWRVSQGNFGDEPRWIAPPAHGMTAGEIYDAAEALRREADAMKTAAQPPAATRRSGRSSPREP